MKRFQLIYLVALILFPIFFWCLPGNFFDDGTIIICFSRRFFGIECLGCGMTRAMMHFHHFEFKNALFFNRGVVLVYPILTYFWFKQLIQTGQLLDVFSKNT